MAQGYQWYRGSTNEVKNSNNKTTGYGNNMNGNTYKPVTNRNSSTPSTSSSSSNSSHSYHQSGFSNSSGGGSFAPQNNNTWATNPDLINANANTTPFRTDPVPAKSDEPRTYENTTKYTPPAETHTYHESGFSHSSNTDPAELNKGEYAQRIRRNPDGTYTAENLHYVVPAAPAVDYAAQEAAAQEAAAQAAARKAAEEEAAKKAAEEEAKKKEAERLEALRLALEAQKKARQDAINAANGALDKLGLNARNQYNTSRGIIGADYQDLRNQLAVQNFKARRAQREALADRGAFNSGNGMQENLLLSSNYNNNMNRINRDEANAYTTLLNNLNTYLGQIETQKATNQNSTLDNYNNVISSLINAEYSGYTPDAGYLALAQSIAGNTPTIAVSPTTITQSTAAPASTDLFNILNTGLARTPATGLSSGDLYNTLLRYGIKQG